MKDSVILKAIINNDFSREDLNRFLIQLENDIKVKVLEDNAKFISERKKMRRDYLKRKNLDVYNAIISGIESKIIEAKAIFEKKYL